MPSTSLTSRRRPHVDRPYLISLFYTKNAKYLYPPLSLTPFRLTALTHRFTPCLVLPQPEFATSPSTSTVTSYLPRKKRLVFAYSFSLISPFFYFLIFFGPPLKLSHFSLLFSLAFLVIYYITTTVKRLFLLVESLKRLHNYSSSLLSLYLSLFFFSFFLL